MKKAYIYNENGYYERESVAQFDPLESDLQGKNIYIMPANSTDKEPLEPKEGFRVKWDGEKWIYEEPEEYTPTDEEQRQARANAYAVEVDPLHSRKQRKLILGEWTEDDETEYVLKIKELSEKIAREFPYGEEIE